MPWLDSSSLAGLAGPQSLQASPLNWQKAALTDPQQQAALYQMFGGPQYWASQGYTGNGPSLGQNDSVTGDFVSGASPDWAKFLQDKGYGYNVAADNAAFRHGQLTQNGQPVEGVPLAQWAEPDNQGFNIARAVTLAGLAYGGAAAAGAGGGSAGVAGDVGGDAAAEGALAGGGATTASPYPYMGAGSAGAGAGTDVAIGADGLAYGAPAASGASAGGGGGNGFFSNLASGNYGDAMKGFGNAAGNYFSSPSGIQSLAGLLGSYYSANKQSAAADNAAQMAMGMYNQTRADNTPYRLGGYQALSNIGDLMGTSGNTSAPNYGSLTHQFNAGDLNANMAPNWKFQLDQGLGATQNAANAAGFSGNALKGVNDYAQGFAGNAYQQAYNNYTNNQTNIYNRLSNLAGLGQTSNGITANAGTNAANQAGNYITSGAAAQAGGIIGGVNSLNNGLNNYQGWNYLLGQQPKP